MTNEIIKQEEKVNVFGIDGRAFNVVMNTETGIIRNQKMSFSRIIEDGNDRLKHTVTMSFDDECGNKHEDFSITSDIKLFEMGRYREYMGGCCHDEIAKHFPEFAHLIKWHLVSVDEPVYYVANTIYHASDKDSGYRKGEPCAWAEKIKFGNSPMLHDLSKGLKEFILSDPKDWKYTYIAVEHNEKGLPGKYQFEPNYTFKGMVEDWYKCPFKNVFEASGWCEALNTTDFEIVKVVTRLSKGKERDLDAARRCAIWPEATDEQLCSDNLKELLEARLPKLLEDFKKEMLSIGFVWPERLKV